MRVVERRQRSIGTASSRCERRPSRRAARACGQFAPGARRLKDALDYASSRRQRCARPSRCSRRTSRARRERKATGRLSRRFYTALAHPRRSPAMAAPGRAHRVLTSSTARAWRCSLGPCHTGLKRARGSGARLRTNNARPRSSRAARASGRKDVAAKPSISNARRLGARRALACRASRRSRDAPADDGGRARLRRVPRPRARRRFGDCSAALPICDDAREAGAS